MANGLTYQRTTTTPEATKQLAATLAPYLHAGDTIVLTGDLGAGKTQFVQGVAAALGVRAAVTSPTFNILLEYHDGRLPLYHYDLYRLDARWQLEDIDYYSAIDGDGDGAALRGMGREVPRGHALRLSGDRTSQPTATAHGASSPHSFGSRSRQLLCVWANDSKSRLGKCQLCRDLGQFAILGSLSCGARAVGYNRPH
ncbi:MAG: tRNA (adenosine(37)-N6)-threonylcarbamoyltransferase complex ATPase subunit type 1 TsaE [Adlercreutzia equolifaciens]